MGTSITLPVQKQPRPDPALQWHRGRHWRPSRDTRGEYILKIAIYACVVSTCGGASSSRSLWAPAVSATVAAPRSSIAMQNMSSKILQGRSACTSSSHHPKSRDFVADYHRLGCTAVYRECRHHRRSHMHSPLCVCL